MKPVDQDQFAVPGLSDGPVGNCYAACLASILELRLSDVPNFAAMEGPEQPGAGGVWWAQTRRWLRAEAGIDIRGLFDLTDEHPTPLSIMTDPPEDPSRFFAIGSLPSPRGPFHHAVVVDMTGTVVHDPHPSRASMGQPIEGVDLLWEINDEDWPLVDPELTLTSLTP